MPSPQPDVTFAPAGNARIVHLAPRGAAGRGEGAGEAANDDLQAARQAQALPGAQGARPSSRRVPLALALAALLWVLSAIFLATLALAYHLLV